MLEPGQSRVVKQLADGAPTADLLATLCQAIEERGAGALASILILDQDGRRLRLGAAPSLPGDFNRALDGVEIGTGAWRAAVRDGTRVIVDDIATDPSWKDCRGLVAGHGFRSCWLQPIRSSSGAALGTLAL